jgi:hypothetical protein
MKQVLQKNRLNRNYLVLVLLIFTGLFIIFLLPAELLFSKPSLCIHYRLFGVQCPLCGTTRGIYSFLHLNFANAWLNNFNVFLLALLLPVLCMRTFNTTSFLKWLEKILIILLVSGYLLIYVTRLSGINFESVYHFFWT